MIHDNGSSNRSGNRSFEDVLHARMSRRNVLARGAALSATGFLAALGGNKLFAQDATAATAQASSNTVAQNAGTAIAQRNSSLINFSFVRAADGAGPTPSISADYQYDVLIPLGHPNSARWPSLQW
ncbi:MAG: hypothetical protein HC832_07090 [Leptolyngbyaceae cyanobacterium RM1_405_57]|nr:hypothetical protein [Leptolyngbyaceae cyanobacterium RM1_405_57]